MQTLELARIKGLGEDIRNIVLCVDIRQGKVPRLDTFLQEVIFDVNMFYMSMEKGVFRKGNGGIIVTEDGGCGRTGHSYSM